MFSYSKHLLSSGFFLRETFLSIIDLMFMEDILNSYAQ